MSAPFPRCASGAAEETKSLTIEEQAVAAFLDHPSDATFASIYRWYVPRLIRYFRFRGCSQAIAEELAQDVMFAVHRESSMLRERGRFRAWLYQIACNTLLQAWRKRSREIETVGLAWAMDVVDRAADPSAAVILRQSMEMVDSEEREILYFRWVEGLEHHEIAEIVKQPLGTVQWRIFRIRKKLAALVR